MRGLVRNERGVSLVIALALIVLLAIIGTTVVSLVGTDTRDSANQLQALQAFYVAEAGLELAIANIDSGGNGNIAGAQVGYGTVSVTNSGDTLLTAVSTVGSFQKRIQVKIRSQGLPEAFSYTVYHNDSAGKLKFQGPHGSFVEGMIFSKGPEIKFDNNTTLGTLTVYATQTATITNQSGDPLTVERYPAANPPTAFPSFSSAYYDSYLSNQGGYPNYGSSTIQTNLSLSSLSGNTLFYNGSELEIKNCTITGPGVIVSTGKLELEHANFNGDITFIAGGEVEVKNGARITSLGSILYSTEGIKIQDNNTEVYGSVLCTGDEVEVKGPPDTPYPIIHGILYNQNGETKFEHGTLYGSMVVNELDGDEIHCSSLYFDPAYLPTSVPPGFSSGTSVEIVQGSWKEL